MVHGARHRLRTLGGSAAALLLAATFSPVAVSGAVSGAAPQAAHRSQAGEDCRSSVSSQAVGRAPDGQQVHRFTLRDGDGLSMQVLTFGGVVQRLRVPDRDGRQADVVLGFRRVRQYAADTDPYFGALIGRYGNRIAKGTFTLDGTTYHLPTNDGPSSLHGGDTGFDDRVWSGEEVRRGCRVGVRLTLVSEAGDQGYPGTLQVQATYWLRGDRSVGIGYRATTDAPTVVNLTNHSYFNLTGEGSGSVLGHRLRIRADRFTPVDEDLIPTGRLARVDGTPFDFRRSKPVGRDIRRASEQLRLAEGYDHNFVLRGRGTRTAARLYDPGSGRVLRIATDQPGVQLYSGNFLDGSLVGKSGRRYRRGGGLALETQHFPDSPNQPSFPSTVLRPGEVHRTHTTWRFSTR